MFIQWNVEVTSNHPSEHPVQRIWLLFSWIVLKFCWNSQLFLGGELHFLQIGGTCDDVDEADILVDASLSKVTEQLTEGTKPLSNPSSPGITGTYLLNDLLSMFSWYVLQVLKYRYFGFLYINIKLLNYLFI